MTAYDATEERLERLELLQPLSPDSARAERVRVRCREHLARSRQRTARTTVMTRRARRVLAPVFVGGFCVLYVAALVTTTLHLYGVFR